MLDLSEGSEAEDVHVRRPEELFEVPGVVQLLLDLPNRVGNSVDGVSPVGRFHLLYLLLVVEDRILEDLFDVLLCDLWRSVTWRSEMLAAING